MFKAGDKVRRVHPVHSSNCLAGFMHIGNIYTVVRAEESRVVLKGCPLPNFTWGEDRFELVTEKPKTTPHVHAEIIKAWADGAEIQFHTGGKFGTWDDTTNPIWNPQFKYRIKPEPKPDVVLYGAENTLRCLRTEDGTQVLSSTFTSRKTKIDRVKYIYDGETGELKSVELIK